MFRAARLALEGEDLVPQDLAKLKVILSIVAMLAMIDVADAPGQAT